MRAVTFLIALVIGLALVSAGPVLAKDKKGEEGVTQVLNIEEGKIGVEATGPSVEEVPLVAPPEVGTLIKVRDGFGDKMAEAAEEL